MEPTAHSPAPAAPRTMRHWLAAGVVLFALGGMAAVAWWSSPHWRERHGTGAAVTTDVRRTQWTLSSDRGRVDGWTDEVSLHADSGPGTPLVDFAVDPTSGGVFAADTTGRLRQLPAPDAADRRPRFEGLLAGFAALRDGRTALLLGRSGYGADYFVRLPGLATPDLPLGFCTRLLATDGASIYYATKRARLGCIAGDGKRRWEIVLDHIPGALAVGSDGNVLVGDDRGGLTRVSADGQVLATFAHRRQPITAVTIRHDSTVVAVDRSGAVGWFDARGERLGSYQSGTGTERIAAVIEHGSDLLLVTARGQARRLVLPANAPAMTLAELESLRLGTALVGVTLVLLGLAAFSRRVTRRIIGTARRLLAARLAYALLLPTFGLLAVFNYYPMVTSLSYSFWKFSLTSPMEFAGLDNFREMAADPYLRQGVVNMGVLLLTGVIKMIVFPLLAAELVFWIASPRLQQFFRAAMTFPAVVPGVVMVLVWKMIYDPYNGLLNLALRAFGLGGLQHAWLGDEHTALWTVVAFNFPWVHLLIFLIFLGGLLQIDRNIFEAADMDGASVRQRFLHIDLPALRPKLQIAITLIFLWSVQDFASVLILTGGGPGVSTYVPALEMFQQISGGQNLGYSSAIGLVLFLLVLGFTVLVQRLNREDPT